MKRVAVVAIAIVAGAALGGAAAAGVDLYRHRGRIYPNVVVEGVRVGGLTPARAREAVAARLAPRLAAPVVVRAGPHRWAAQPGALGARFEIDRAIDAAFAVARTGSIVERARARWGLRARPASVTAGLAVDRAALHAFLKDIADAVQVQPEPARITVAAGRVVIVPSRDGVRFDLAATADRLEQGIRAGAPEVDAAVEIRRPTFTTERAESLGITAPIAAFSTQISGDANRLHNVALAASRLRGLLLEPGAVLSYNQAVGPRTLAAGFREAPVLIDDELVPGDGGGVCQVSSTLFNVVLLSDFEVLERTNHSRPVAYLPLGRDATVVYGAIDLRARNTTGGGVLLWTEVRGRRLTIVAYGRARAGRNVRVVTTDLVSLPPPEATITKLDPKLPAGETKEIEAAPGYRLTTVRQVYDGGVLIRSEVVARSHYRPVAHTIKIGSAPPDGVVTP